MNGEEKEGDFVRWNLLNTNKTKNRRCIFLRKNAGLTGKDPESEDRKLEHTNTWVDNTALYQLRRLSDSFLFICSFSSGRYYSRRQGQGGKTLMQGQLCSEVFGGLIRGGRDVRNDGKTRAIMDNTSHSLPDTLIALSSTLTDRLVHYSV